MCVIVVKPKDIKIKREVWAECFRCNGHGAGLAYVENNKLVVDKGYFNFDALYLEIDKRQQQELLVHFRISSAGNIRTENCHPFFTKSKNVPRFSFAITHNGTLPWRSTKEESDTNLFVAEILGPIFDRDPYFLDSYMGNVLLERFIGDGDKRQNKLAIMRYDAKEKETKTYIVNKAKGVDDLGCWFSNSSYKVWTNYCRTWGGHQSVYDYENGDSFMGINPKDIADDLPVFMSEEDWSMYGYYQDEVTGKWTHNSKKPKNKAIPFQPSEEWKKGKSVMDIEAECDAKQRQQEQLKLTEGKKVDGTIVPRDVPVAEQIERNAKQSRKNERLEHLSKKGKKTFRRMAHDFCRMGDYNGLTTAEKVEVFRHEYRFNCTKDDDVRKMSDECLDKFILDEYNETGKYPEIIEPYEPGDAPPDDALDGDDNGEQETKDPVQDQTQEPKIVNFPEIVTNPN